MNRPIQDLHVAVLMGGISPEREVSLSSGRMCADALEGRRPGSPAWTRGAIWPRSWPT